MSCMLQKNCARMGRICVRCASTRVCMGGGMCLCFDSDRAGNAALCLIRPSHGPSSFFAALQQAALSSMLPLLPYTSISSSDTLANLGSVNGASASGSGEGGLTIDPLNQLSSLPPNSSNLSDLTMLLRQTAQIDMAIAAHAQAMDAAAAAAAGWDPLACLITPRNNSPAGQTGRAGRHQLMRD